MGLFRKARITPSGGPNLPGPVWGSQQAHGTITSLCCSTRTMINVWKNVPSTDLLERTLDSGGLTPCPPPGTGSVTAPLLLGKMCREMRRQAEPLLA